MNNAKIGELKSTSKGLFWYYSKLVELTASRALFILVKSISTIKISKLVLKVDIEFNLAWFGF